MVIEAGTREKIDHEIARYPVRRGALLPALRLVQQQIGHVPREAVVELGEIFELPPVEVYTVLSFYNMLHMEPEGRHHVHVCTNLPCSLRGARPLLRALEAHLGIREGETTPDGRITLGREECLGACGYAPMMRIDGAYHEDLDVDEARRILDQLE